MIEILMHRGKMNRLAHSGEKNAVRAVFDLEPFQRLFPGGTPLLLVRRRGDKEGYPVNLETDGSKAYWLLSSADTASPGVGQCELRWTVGETLVKSDKYDFLVLEALPAGTQPPDDASQRWFEAIQSQIGDLSDLTTKATENLVAAINEAAKTGSGGSGSIDMQVADGYIQYSTDGGKTWENLIAVAGLKGEDGYSPTASVSKSGKVTTITITDKNGTTTAGVEDGADGVPGATPNIQIGTVTTLDAGADATASMSGTAENPLLNLGIPKGEAGGSDLSLGLTGAQIGQIAKITAVDASGKPTQWEATALPNEAFIVYFTWRDQFGGDPILTSDRTPEEVIAAIASKKLIIALLNRAGEVTQLCSIDNSIGTLHFFTIGTDGNVVGIGWDVENDMSGEKTYTLTAVHPGNFIKYNGLLGQNQIFGTGETGGYEFKQHIGFENLPEVTTSDNGKFLRVVNGAWAAAEIASAGGVSF